MMKARFYEFEGQAVHCKLCHHGCVIKDGKIGLCGVRHNIGGILYAESYGRLSGLALDPIEKKPLRRFHPGRDILSVGSYGCNMSCAFCQNCSISQEVPPTKFMSPEELLDIAKSERNNLGIAFTYNEPLMGMEYLLDTAPLFQDAGFKVVLVTNGMVTREPLEALLPYVDAMNIDVKGFTPEYYRTLGGDLETVKQTVKRCVTDCHIEVTTLIVPDKNDGDSEMTALSEWLASISPDIPLHITRFFPRYKLTDTLPTPIETLSGLAKIAKQSLRYVYMGNI